MGKQKTVQFLPQETSKIHFCNPMILNGASLAFPPTIRAKQKMSGLWSVSTEPRLWRKSVCLDLGLS